MRAKHKGLLALFVALIVQISFAQDKTITGIVSDADGLPLPGVNIVVQGTTTGTQTDFDGNYSIGASEGQNLSFSYLGFKTESRLVGASNTINVQMVEDAEALEEVVVTALGIKREKQALGYATTEVSGDQVNTAKETNFMNSLSGKVAGLDVKKSSSLGGSSNIVIRGYTSITGNNQPLFVVDGTPIGNSNTNTSGQTTGRGGYDYGNAAMDVNPEDIESVNVLKGAAATNLYGSRAANGVIIITTKTGKKGQGLGVTVNSGVTMAKYDPDTFPKYQNEYGAGYGAYYSGPGGYFFEQDVDGDGIDDLTTVFTEDASFGAAFDPNLLVYQWDAFYPESSNYLTATPYLAGKNGPESVFITGVTLNNSVSLSAGSETGSFRLGYTNLDQTGIVPNSQIQRHTIDFNGSQELSDRLRAGVKATFTKTDGKGRYGTGYDGNNLMQSFRQWHQRNVDFQAQKDAYFDTRRNITWNYSGDPLTEDGQVPIFFDNPYWVLYENFQTDTRNRLFGNINLTYDIADWLSVTGRTSLDTYAELQEERHAVGSVPGTTPQNLSYPSRYRRYNRSYTELNYDLLLNYDFDLSEKLSLDGVLGATARQQRIEWIRAATSGGLVVPRLYSLSNSQNLLEAPTEYLGELKQYGFFGNASFGYDGVLYLDLSARYDISSTLPDSNNGYFYPAVSTSFVFSKLLNADWLSFGKLRANYAEVGNSTVPQRVFNAYFSPTNFGSVPLFSVDLQANNSNLVNELSKSYELGLEMNFANKRAGFDISYYKTNTVDQIFPVAVSRATGYSDKVVNSGDIENKGFEVALFVSPVKTEDFEWTVNATWFKNKSEVIRLFDGVDNVQLTSNQGGVTINATVGQPYGSIWGTNFTYLNGERVIDADTGRYVVDATPQPIGDFNPDWKGGVNNLLRYKNLSMSFLIDVQKGGDVFSLDTWYGYATGVYDVTAGLNELGNPKRDPVDEGGGILLEGVNPDGSPNTTRTRMDYYAHALGYTRAPNALHVYDASFVKLREVTFSYKLPNKMLKNIPINNMTFSLVGRNLWIIDKNMPYTDPEAGLSSGNLQGYQSSPYPTAREYGFNVRFDF
ncbi:SusC/RagA family TonB-linked outer membrane protein [Pareuzebyella sediminis]|uniref:SusC/RagA family TonB-linked outer membrane protein n=1 Tax=Pareuzebyella sediminis TaxID=2607998 RepID=UPI0011ED1C98|nr:SusC/RagA family TonB-linked outer membrane protein [Pareuzebyella sediminis]